MNSGVVDSREILEFIRNIVEDSSIDDESLEICNRTIDFVLKRIDEYGLLKTQLEIAEQTIKLNEWVSIDDRLPEEEKFVLVTINSDASIKKVTIGYVTMARDDNDVLYGEWFDELFCEIDGVVAWKPLPEPYSESKAFIKNVAKPFSKGIQDGSKGSNEDGK